MKQYDIAAYVWPAFTGDEPRSRLFWPEGIGEWQTVKNEVRQYPEFSLKRKPLWGYVNEADPAVMEMEIEQAVSHGVNVFIYDWYWYDDKWYWFDGAGRMVKNTWYKYKDKWYYLGADGAMLTGQQTIDGKWYVLNEDGAMVTDPVTLTPDQDGALTWPGLKE